MPSAACPLRSSCWAFLSMAASGLKLRGATTSHSLAYKDLKHFLEDPASDRHWDDLLRTTWFQLREGETLRTAWFDDARSLREKLRLVQLYHLRGYAAWRLGVEDPEFWQRSDSE